MCSTFKNINIFGLVTFTISLRGVDNFAAQKLSYRFEVSFESLRNINGVKQVAIGQ